MISMWQSSNSPLRLTLPSSLNSTPSVFLNLGVIWGLLLSELGLWQGNFLKLLKKDQAEADPVKRQIKTLLLSEIHRWGLGGPEARGTQEILQKLNVTIYAPKDCKEAYAHRVSRRMLCAGYVDGGKDSCMGDSGGPLVLEDAPQVWHQVGTVSWGDGCAQSKSPGAYIRMTEVGQWIHYHSNSNGAVWCGVPGRKDASN